MVHVFYFLNNNDNYNNDDDDDDDDDDNNNDFICIMFISCIQIRVALYIVQFGFLLLICHLMIFYFHRKRPSIYFHSIL